MTPQTAQPLPECLCCDTPTRRATWTANGGLCSACQAQRIQFATPRRHVRGLPPVVTP